jgi:hypothetical protein
MPAPNDPELRRINSIITSNGDKSFVRRIIAPNIFPKLANEDGTVSTHSMAWGEADGRYFVYPTVVSGEDSQLRRLDDKEAFDHALRTKEFIELGSAEEADWFSKKYKRVWEQN